MDDMSMRSHRFEGLGTGPGHYEYGLEHTRRPGMFRVLRRVPRIAILLAVTVTLGAVAALLQVARRPPVVVELGASAPEPAADDPLHDAAEWMPSVDLPNTAATEDPDDGHALQIMVHVAGAVARPGVYRLPEGARVVDAVQAAGGVAASASTDSVNLALPVRDGEQIYIPRSSSTPTPGSAQAAAAGGPASSPGAVGAVRADAMPENRADISRRLPDDSHARLPSSGAAEGASSGMININTASVDELDTLPGVGPATARKIIEYREANGPFLETRDLLGVSGIGDVKYSKIAPLIRVR